jgi:two-component system CheB/CheR fusion protein
MTVEPNSIYLIPPKKEMIISGGRLLLTDKDPQQELHLPIDHFFRSLAHDAGTRAIAIVLSGTGSDGSRGIRDVHEAGGLILAQTENSAKFDGMPRSASDTGVVDAVLSPEQMPKALVDYVASCQSGKQGSAGGDAPIQGVDAIFKLLRDEYGIDFSHYKPNTVSRRIERRLALNHAVDLESYVARLRTDPTELNSLYRDLLIGVTRFFRDREAFERLETAVLPQLLSRKRAGEELRCWVAGAATGEEAYSLAILLHERLQLSGRPLNVKIFATDVHGASLEVASAGVYDNESLADVRTNWLERYFVKKNGGYQVASEIRQMIVFARHNVIKDAPFTKLDLITCRNLLIYFQPHAQKKALSLFHFGLRTSGILFLGPSETPGELAPEFESLDDHWKIYRKRRDIRLPADLRLPLTQPPTLMRPSIASGSSSGVDVNLLTAYDRLLDDYVPAGLLINDRRQLIHAFGGAGQLLIFRDGRAGGDALDMVQDDLKLALAGSLQRAAKEQRPVVYAGVRLETRDGERQYKLTVKPLLNRHGNLTHYFILLDDGATAIPQTQHEIDVNSASREQVNSLELELRHTRENLQATIEELETSNEELQASNEELVASNEELQSTNEELHSVNEELYTVNAEYQKKISELTELTDDMDHLLRGTDIGTIFLDKHLCIRKFTPQIGKVFDLLPQDIGRRIDSFSHNIVHQTLHDDVSTVLETGKPIEKEVRDRHGSWYFLRILPYSSHSRLDGVVLSLIDISLLKRAESNVKRLSAIVESSDDAIIGMDLNGTITTWNRGAERLYGYSAAEVIGRPVSMLRADVDEQSQGLDWPPEVLERIRAGKPADYRIERSRRRKDGLIIDVLMSFSAIRDEAGNVIGVSKISRDVTEQNRNVNALAERARLSAMRAEVGSILAQDQPLEVVLQRVSECVVQHLGAALARIWTLNNDDRTLELIATAGKAPPDDAQQRLPLGAWRIGQIAQTRDVQTIDHLIADPQLDDVRWMRQERISAFAGYPLLVSDNVVGVLAVFGRSRLEQAALDELRSIGYEVAQCIERKHAEQQRLDAQREAQDAVRRRDQFLAMLSHELRNPLAAVVNASRLLESEPDEETLNIARGAIARQSQHMARLLDDLLDVSRITRDKIEIRRQIVDLRQTSHDAVESIRPLLDGRQVQLIVNLPPGPVCVEGDPARLQQIQVNLLNNAVKYTPDGGKIWLTVSEEAGKAVISVRDTGVGIPPEMREKIFEIFVQLERDAASSGGGMGVGLTLVRALVQLHGGEIAVHSAGHNKGSEFAVRLPLAPHEKLAAPKQISTEALRGVRVLLIEDNDDLRAMTQRVLKSLGCNVQTAPDGPAGLELIQQARPDVALVDIGMPLMDGHEVARRIRQLPGGEALRLIAITGFGQPEDRQKAIEAGFDAHLVKPVSLSELTKVLLRFAGGQSASC